MLTSMLLCAAISGTDVDEPASAHDAVLMARLPDYFGEPDAETAALFAMPVAKVNGETILAGTLLTRYDLYLQSVRIKVAADEYVRIVQGIVKRDLPATVEAAALWSRVKAEYSAEMQDNLRRQLEPLWQQQMTKLARELDVPNRQFLIRPSLESLREQFIRQGMMRAFVASKVADLQSQEYQEFRAELLRTAKIETTYDVSLDELK